MLQQNELEIARNAPAPGCSTESAQQYTRWLATHHYENFNVVSWLLPKALHQHFYNVYAYCRWADNLGDEVPNPMRALQLIDWWECELDLCYEGKPSHPVFVALRQTILAKDIPKQPFAGLLKAFRQDQTTSRYSNWDAVSRDLDKGRIYIPLDAAAAQGLTEEDIVERRFDDRFVSLMQDLIARTRALFAEGLPLARMVDKRFSFDIAMFSRGGIAVLDAIEAMGYDTLHKRPAISKLKQARLLGSTLVKNLVARDSHSATISLMPSIAGAHHVAPPSATTVAESYENCH